MKRIENCFGWKNRPSHDLVGDDFDIWICGKQRYAVERIKPFVSKVWITIRGFINDVLRCYQFVVGSFMIPPLVGKNLPSRRNDLCAWSLPKVTDEGN